MSIDESDSPTHEYNPEQALLILIEMVGERDSMLASEIESVIAAGTDDRPTDAKPTESDKDGFQLEGVTGVRKPSPERSLRRYSGREALDVALDLLRAYFIDQPQIQNSIIGTFSDNLSTEGSVRDSLLPEISIEIVPDRGIVLEETSDPFLLESVQTELISEQHERISELSEMFRFSGD